MVNKSITYRDSESVLEIKFNSVKVSEKEKEIENERDRESEENEKQLSFSIDVFVIYHNTSNNSVYTNTHKQLLDFHGFLLLLLLVFGHFSLFLLLVLPIQFIWHAN